MSRAHPRLRRWIARLLRGSFTSRIGSKGSPILAFFPSSPHPSPAGGQGPGGEACPHCGAALRSGSGLSSGSSIVAESRLWSLAIGLTLAAATGFWLGRESGRAAAIHARPAQGGATPVPTPRMTPGVRSPPGREAVDPVATASGTTWAIYSSQDRLTDRPLFGARFGTRAGAPLFSVLCAEGRGALSLKRGLLPATEAASGNLQGLVATIQVAIQLVAREHHQVVLRFEDAPAESLNAIPSRPGDFLRRVVTSRRIRTASDDFDPADWHDTISRVIAECRFDAPVEAQPKRRKAVKPSR